MNTTDSRLKKLLKRDEITPKIKKKAKGNEQDVDISKIELMSESELVEIADAVGIPKASRALGRDRLMELILGMSDSADIQDPVESVRAQIWRYVQGNKSLMISNVSCDLHCPTCPRRRVVECFTDNHDLVGDE